MTVDNLNNQIVIKDHGLNIQSALVSDLNMGGRSIINIANPTIDTGVANKGYVDGFFD